MIALEIRIDPKCRAEFQRLASEFPREMQRANGRAASIVRSKLRAIMREGGGETGVPGFASLNPLTITLRNGHTDFGGKLSEPKSIVMFRRGAAQVVGWPDRLAGYASSFQSAENREMDNKELSYLYRASGWIKGRIPHQYARPARPVVEPLIRGIAPEYPKWILSAATKLISKTLTKKSF